MPILSQKISNHPIFTDVERYVEVTKQHADSEIKEFRFWFTIKYCKEGDDVTFTFKQPSKNTIFTNASILQLVRDPLTYEPVPNPDYNPEDFSEDNPATEYDIYKSINGWDMIVHLINKPTNIAETIRQYILINDQENFFNT